MGSANTDRVKAYRKTRKLIDPAWAAERRKKERINHKKWIAKALLDPKRSHKVVASLRKRQMLSRRRTRLVLKVDVINHYGGKCKCCGEKQLMFLTIDHPKGGGIAHRREIRSHGGEAFYDWLKRHRYPKGYRVLCYNCNCGRHLNGGICPHKGVPYDARG